jgi:hypothetical protein
MFSDSMKPPISAYLEVSNLRLDLDNPRLFHQRLTGTAPTNEVELMSSISGDADFKKLLKSIKRSGVMDPIWVLPQLDGTYLVIEGNRRTTSLKTLVAQGATNPNVNYSKVQSLVMDPSTTPEEVKLQKARLQTGKREWGVFNVGALVHEFHHGDLMAIEDIATEMQESVGYIKKLLQSYEMFIGYSTSTGDTSKNRFAMFNEAPKKVIEWVQDSPTNKEDYHKFINPTSGKAKIRSASTKGGLRDFAKVIEDMDALTLLRDDPRATVEDALEVVKQNDIQKEMPWLTRILTLQANINGITSEQLARLATEAKVSIHLKSLRAACDNLLNDIEALNS